MRLATIRVGEITAAARLDDGEATVIDGFADVGELLAAPDWDQVAADAAADVVQLADLRPQDWAPVIPRPGKVLCVGLNYRSHITEMGRELPEFPTLFNKYPEALVGPYDPIAVPADALETLDWEGELAVVIGRAARDVEPSQAHRFIAGYSILNDVTVRGYQYRTSQWMQGKTFESSTPFGPYLVTGADAEGVTSAELTTEIDGQIVQRATVDDLLFGPEPLVAYLSHIFTLQPGDVIATGTPGGVGHASTPPRYLKSGEVLRTAIDGLGEMRNEVRG